MSEKRKPTYDLAAFRAWAKSDTFRVTGTALRTASALGYASADIVEILLSMHRDHFVKSMTSHADHRLWQDVYYVPSPAGILYVKFQRDVVSEFLLLSFKEKDDG